MARGSGSNAATPLAMPWPAWKAIVSRTLREASQDNVGLIAAGVAFYGFLALVPLLGAIVLSYGIVAEPETVMRNMAQLTSVMPADAAKLVGEQLLNVVKAADGKKGIGLLLALGMALFGARNGAGAIITALNIAYEEEEKRGFIRLNLLALTMTGAAVLVAVLALVAIAALGYLETMLPALPDWAALVGKLIAYLLLTAAGAAGAATLYRYGPSRERARWMWITPGSAFSAIGWLVLTIGFGVYVANFGNYNATYGSLGTVVVLLTWLYLSSYILLFGAELNSEVEHQTAIDTTAGPVKPIGQRGAWVADHVVDAADRNEAVSATSPLAVGETGISGGPEAGGPGAEVEGALEAGRLAAADMAATRNDVLLRIKQVAVRAGFSIGLAGTAALVWHLRRQPAIAGRTFDKNPEQVHPS